MQAEKLNERKPISDTALGIIAWLLYAMVIIGVWGTHQLLCIRPLLFN